MLTVYCGDDIKKAEAGFASATKGATRLVPDLLPEGALEELAAHADMFGTGTSYAFRGDLPENYVILIKSPSNFFILASVLTPPVKKSLIKQGAILEEYSLSESSKVAKEKLDKQKSGRIFKVADRLAARDRKGLWIEYWRLMESGVDAEEIFWKLQWQTKAMLVSSRASSASEAGLHPFVYSKSRAGAANYSKEELISISGKLLDLWRDTHSGRKELPLALEQFILEI